MQIQPYIFLDGRCREAIDFYTNTLDAELLMRMLFSENPGPEELPPGVTGDKIMHAALRIGDSQIFLSDGHCAGKPEFRGFSLSLALADDRAAKRTFDALAQGGNVTVPLTQTFFASSFCMVTDRFGMPWMVVVQR
ncbi:MAG TPA: glyoxalase/bleomycin resistance/extradiol dioxygenase family protein [Rhodopila sp.]|nr:glyoxalase/bleomycin resistance/extradiol dioxygenase family protein [Rhodopila sp.]